MSLEWWCANCTAREPVEETGDPEQDYDVGDSDVCPDCGDRCVVRETLKGPTAK